MFTIQREYIMYLCVFQIFDFNTKIIIMRFFIRFVDESISYLTQIFHGVKLIRS